MKGERQKEAALGRFIVVGGCPGCRLSHLGLGLLSLAVLFPWGVQFEGEDFSVGLEIGVGGEDGPVASEGDDADQDAGDAIQAPQKSYCWTFTE